nr:glycine/sarcosine/betaine reductase component B subunit [Brachyspira hyodysenteriae]
MKLEIGEIYIKDIKLDKISKVRMAYSYVNADEVTKIVLEDDKLKSVKLIICSSWRICTYYSSKRRN